MRDTQWTRRGVLGAMAGGAAALVAGCKTPDDVRPPTGKLHVPTAMPQRHFPGMVPSGNPGVPPAFERFAAHPFRSVDRPPVTSGKEVSTLQILWGVPPPSMSDDPWWLELNKRLGAPMNPLLAPAASFGDKLMTVMASGDLPDLTYIHTDYAPGIQRAILQGAFTELSRYLSGDAVKEFPNLAQLPTYSWKNSAMQGGIYGVPRPIPIVNGRVGLYRRDWARKLGFSEPPKNADELYEMFSGFAKKGAVTKKRSWAMANIDVAVAQQMYRVPNGWRLEKSGRLVNALETDEFEAALEFMRKLWKAGAIHPDGPNLSSDQLGDLFKNGQTGYYAQGYIPEFGVSGTRGVTKEANKDADPYPFMPPGHDGGDPLMYQGPGYYGYMGIPSKIGKDEKRTRELLGVLDYFAAPFGSEEYVFMTYGLEGKMFKYDKQGNPVSTGDTDSSTWMGLNYMCEPMEMAFYFPGAASDALLAQRALQKAVPISVPNPTLGLVSQTAINRAPALSQLNTDFQNSIVMGNRSISVMNDWRNRWRSSGGDKMRSEYEESLARTS